MIPEPFFINPAIEEGIFTRFWQDWTVRVRQAIGVTNYTYTASNAHTFGLIAAGATATITVTVNGAATNDDVTLGLHTVDAGLVYQAWVSAANTITIACTNTTAGGITPTAGDIRVTVRSF